MYYCSTCEHSILECCIFWTACITGKRKSAARPWTCKFMRWHVFWRHSNVALYLKQSKSLIWSNHLSDRKKTKHAYKFSWVRIICVNSFPNRATNKLKTPDLPWVQMYRLIQTHFVTAAFTSLMWEELCEHWYLYISDI